MRAAAFRIIENTNEHLLIKDLGPWDIHPTVTNDAEGVVERLAAVLEGRRLYYLDSEGERAELLVKDGKFAGFGPGVPLLPESKCPVCGYVVDAATQAGGDSHAPAPGDLSVCLKCGEIQAYGQDLALRPVTLTELMSLKPSTSALLTEAQRVIRLHSPLRTKPSK